MFDLDNITEKNTNKDPPGSGKTNYLLNSIQKDNNIVDEIIYILKI